MRHVLIFNSDIFGSDNFTFTLDSDVFLGKNLDVEPLSFMSIESLNKLINIELNDPNYTIYTIYNNTLKRDSIGIFIECELYLKIEE